MYLTSEVPTHIACLALLDHVSATPFFMAYIISSSQIYVILATILKQVFLYKQVNYSPQLFSICMIKFQLYL